MDIDLRTFNNPLDSEKVYPARIVGIVNMGRREKPMFGRPGMQIVPEVGVWCELLEERTFESIGKPRIVFNIMRASDHVLSRMMKLCKDANPDSLIRTETPRTGYCNLLEEEFSYTHTEITLDIGKIINCLVGVKVRASRNTDKYSVSETLSLDKETLDQYDRPLPPETKSFVYDAVIGEMEFGELENVPTWILKYVSETILD